jgi:glycosyltransferase involved in cell wall biosynthesis
VADRPGRAVFATANYWGSPIQTGSQHYARLFAEAGWPIAYLSDQISPLHLFRWKSRAYTADKFRLWLRGGMRGSAGNRLFAYNHLTLLPVHNAPFLRSEFVARSTFDVTVPNVFGRLRRAGFDSPDLLWIDHLLYADLPARIHAAQTVYRLADDPRLFPETYPPSLLRRFDRLVRSVDRVIVTARRLEEQVRRLRSDGVVYVPNGVDYQHFAAAARVPPEYAAIPQPRAVYVGSLEPWLNVPLLANVARARPKVSFVVIGPARISMGELRRMPNVHLLGPRPYAILPGYLAHADVGIIPFHVSEQVDAVNPIKLYEYLAAGLPVVVTAWDELRRMQPPATLVAGADEFVQAIDTALAQPGDPEPRRAFARGNSWEARFAMVRAALGLSAQ